MAKIYPRYALDPSHVPSDQQLGLQRERETLSKLSTSLPDSYTVFHSTHIAWTDRYLRKREADFLVVNRAGRVLMVEQKTGRLEEGPNGLHKTYGPETKSIVDQCEDAMDGLRKAFNRAYPGLPALEIRYMLYCPDHMVRDRVAAGIAPEQIVDATNARSLPQIIRRLLPDSDVDTERFTRVRRMFSQELRLDPDNATLIRQSDRLVTAMTDEMLHFLGAIDMKPYRLRIDGTAGCGKTQLIGWFVEQARSAQKRCLVVCFNRLLADELRLSLPPDVVVDTLHGLARRLLEAKNQAPDMQTVGQAGFFLKMLKDATDLALENSDAAWRFDRLIVDEGQDIAQEGYEFVELLLAPNADVVWMQDEHQRLYGGRPLTKSGFVGFNIKDNYRTPRRIARFIQHALGIEFAIRNPLVGDTVQVHEYSADQEDIKLAQLLDERVTALLQTGLQPEQIVILTGRGTEKSRILQRERIAGLRTRRQIAFTGDGTPIVTDGILTLETLWRFKGQQAHTVIVCELDGSLTDDFLKNRLYVAATRATFHLEFMMPKGSLLATELSLAAARSVGS